MDVRDAREWWTMVTEAGVCGHCAAKGHSARYCPLNRHGNGNGNGNGNGSGKGKKMQDGKGDQLNAMIPEYATALVTKCKPIWNTFVLWLKTCLEPCSPIQLKPLPALRSWTMQDERN